MLFRVGLQSTDVSFDGVTAFTAKCALAYATALRCPRNAAVTYTVADTGQEVDEQFVRIAAEMEGA